MRGIKIRISLFVSLGCITLTGCTTYIAMTKPASSDFVQLAVADDQDGKPAVAIHKVSTAAHGFQVLSVPRAQRVLYLLPNEYVVELRCLRVFGKNPGHTMPSYNSYLEDGYSSFTFSVEAGKRYLLDCEAGEDMADFLLMDADSRQVIEKSPD